MSDIFIKICSITNLPDAIMAQICGANAIGFILTPSSPRHICHNDAAKIVKHLTLPIETIGVWVNPTAQEVSKAIKTIGLSMLQFHGEESDEFCDQFGLPFIKSIAMTDTQSIQNQMNQYPSAKALVLDTHLFGQTGGTGQRFDWDLFPKHSTKPLILAGGLTPDNVEEAIRNLAPFGVDVSSGVEQSIGKKDPLKLKYFCKQARLSNG